MIAKLIGIELDQGANVKDAIKVNNIQVNLTIIIERYREKVDGHMEISLNAFRGS